MVKIIWIFFWLVVEPPNWKICSSNWIISPQIGMKKNMFKTATLFIAIQQTFLLDSSKRNTHSHKNTCYLPNLHEYLVRTANHPKTMLRPFATRPFRIRDGENGGLQAAHFFRSSRIEGTKIQLWAFDPFKKKCLVAVYLTVIYPGLPIMGRPYGMRDPDSSHTIPISLGILIGVLWE